MNFALLLITYREKSPRTNFPDIQKPLIKAQGEKIANQTPSHPRQSPSTIPRQPDRISIWKKKGRKKSLDWRTENESKK